MIRIPFLEGGKRIYKYVACEPEDLPEKLKERCRIEDGEMTLVWDYSWMMSDDPRYFISNSIQDLIDEMDFEYVNPDDNYPNDIDR